MVVKMVVKPLTPYGLTTNRREGIGPSRPTYGICRRMGLDKQGGPGRRGELRPGPRPDHLPWKAKRSSAQIYALPRPMGPAQSPRRVAG
jgi:hypothetical protein